MNLEDYSSPEEFFKACAELHKDEDDPEFMFQDFEGFPKEFYSESMSVVDAEKLYEYINLEPYERELVDEYFDATGYSANDVDFADAIDSHYCTLEGLQSNEYLMGEYIVDNGLEDIPDHLVNYIDYEALGRSYLDDMSVSSNGFVFTNN